MSGTGHSPLKSADRSVSAKVNRSDKFIIWALRHSKESVGGDHHEYLSGRRTQCVFRVELKVKVALAPLREDKRLAELERHFELQPIQIIESKK